MRKGKGIRYIMQTAGVENNFGQICPKLSDLF